MRNFYLLKGHVICWISVFLTNKMTAVIFRVHAVLFRVVDAVLAKRRSWNSGWSSGSTSAWARPSFSKISRCRRVSSITRWPNSRFAPRCRSAGSWRVRIWWLRSGIAVSNQNKHTIWICITCRARFHPMYPSTIMAGSFTMSWNVTSNTQQIQFGVKPVHYKSSS